MAPSAPTNPQSSSITATTFLASWTAPSSNGGLALRNYTVETRRDGSEICPGDADYQVALEGISSGAMSATMRDLHPYSRYTFRVVAFNSVFRSPPSVVSADFQTQPAGEKRKFCTDYMIHDIFKFLHKPGCPEIFYIHDLQYYMIRA